MKRSLGRWELLGWLNDFLSLDYSKVEDCADGIAYCQIFDAIYPGKVPLHKLNFQAKTQDEKLKNLRILEKATRESGVLRPVQVEKIASGSFPENLAFLQYCHGLVQKNCPGAHLQYNAYRRRMEALEKGGHRAETRAHPMYKEYREKGWRGLGGGIDASTSGSTDAMPERLYSSSLQHSTKRDDLAPLDFMQEAQRFSPDGQDHRPIRQRQKTSSKSRSVAGGLQGEDWLSGKNLVASTQRGHETGVRHSSFRPPPEKHANEILFTSSGRLLRELQPQRYSGLVESESDEDSQDRHGEMEIKASSPLIFDDPDIDDLLQHQVDPRTSESARMKSHQDVSQREDHFMQEKIEKLLSMMQQDLTSRLMSQAAKREKIRQLQEERDFYLDKLERISRLCQQFPSSLTSSQIDRVISADLSCFHKV
uniref:Calponin-homology (CH) domain-containing protein n=2 Tax=Guillardia theta TaxID=55529 RepID=A0A7S4PQA0_GUITH|mmetsp:Transcript_8860/g.29604  ORF Transcript_8860/g.29604 Transcript_8860/m.29604 type:complete len:423 (+) Transcript_8860:52-1320(+)